LVGHEAWGKGRARASEREQERERLLVVVVVEQNHSEELCINKLAWSLATARSSSFPEIRYEIFGTDEPLDYQGFACHSGCREL